MVSNASNENIDGQAVIGIIDRRMASMRNTTTRMNTCSENINNTRVNDDLVRGILNHFQSLQVNLCLPTFDGLTCNPIEFIQNFEKYLLRKNIVEEAKLLIVEDALKGKATVWYDARAIPFADFLTFKKSFLSEFYSIEARMSAKSDWESSRFKMQDRSLQSYFVEQVRMARFCLTSLQEYEINYLIVKQLPQRAREVLATIAYADTVKISQTLGRLDLARQDREDVRISATNPPNMQGYKNRNYEQAYQNKIDNNNHYDSRNVNKNNHFPNNASQRQPPRQVRQMTRASSFSSNGNRGGTDSRVGVQSVDDCTNWRQRSEPANAYVEDVGSRSNGNCETRAENVELTGNGVGENVNINTIKKSNMSEFAEQLAWDVDPESDAKGGELGTRIISPRISAMLLGEEVTILVDCGSEVTCMSERYYEQIKKRYNKEKIVEWEVSQP